MNDQEDNIARITTQKLTSLQDQVDSLIKLFRSHIQIKEQQEELGKLREEVRELKNQIGQNDPQEKPNP